MPSVERRAAPAVGTMNPFQAEDRYNRLKLDCYSGGHTKQTEQKGLRAITNCGMSDQLQHGPL